MGTNTSVKLKAVSPCHSQTSQILYYRFWVLHVFSPNMDILIFYNLWIFQFSCTDPLNRTFPLFTGPRRITFKSKIQAADFCKLMLHLFLWWYFKCGKRSTSLWHHNGLQKLTWKKKKTFANWEDWFLGLSLSFFRQLYIQVHCCYWVRNEPQKWNRCVSGTRQFNNKFVFLPLLKIDTYLMWKHQRDAKTTWEQGRIPLF